MCVCLLQVPLGVTLKSEMKYDEMMEIIEILQKYVPLKECKEVYTIPSTGTRVEVTQQKVHQILFELTAKH